MAKTAHIDIFEIQRQASELRALETQRLVKAAASWLKKTFAFPKMELDVA